MASPSPEARTVLIDGSGYIFRAFYGIRHLSTSEGHPTNATYGFVQMLVRLLWDVQAERVVVVFDAPGPTFRNERYPEYKAHRKPMPEELRPQLPDIRAMVDAFGIPRVEQVGFEADDLIATYAEEARAAGLVPIAVVSGDKDLLQLVAPDLVMWDTMKEVVYDRAGAEAKLGVPPERVTDFLGLAGDSSDNIPGIRGIGPKSAVKLLAEFGSLDGVFAAAPEAWGKMQKKLSVEGARESAFLSRELATVMRDVPVAKPLTALVPRPPDLDQLARLFQRFEFHRLVDRVPGLRARMHALESGLVGAEGAAGEGAPASRSSGGSCSAQRRSRASGSSASMATAACRSKPSRWAWS